MLFSKGVERVGGGGKGRKGNERGKEGAEEEKEEEKKKRDLERYFFSTFFQLLGLFHGCLCYATFL